jgi:2-dehydropantoate 2-reductase
MGPRVAVIGAGAVGGFFAARAAAAGADVTVCVRTPFERLTVHSPDGIWTSAVRVTADPGTVTATDWVFLATKVHQNAAARPWLEALVGPATTVVILQNGVRHVERVSPPAPAGQVLPAVVYINAEPVSPGVIVHRNYGYVIVPSGPPAERLAAVFASGAAASSSMGIVRPTDDFATAAWSKLTSNAAVNSLTALTGQRIEVLRRDDIGTLALTLMRECVAVARADGAAVDPGLPEATLVRLRGQPPGAGTSMLYDRLAGRPLEYDALVGAVARIGAEHGVPTPASAGVLPLLAAISDAAGG